MGHIGFWVFKFKVKMIVVGASSSKAPKAAAVKSRAKSVKAWIFSWTWGMRDNCMSTMPLQADDSKMEEAVCTKVFLSCQRCFEIMGRG